MKRAAFFVALSALLLTAACTVGPRYVRPSAPATAPDAWKTQPPWQPAAPKDTLPKGEWWPRRVPVEIRYGKPFLVLQKRSDGERVSHQEASDRIMLAIAELLPPEKRGAFSDLESLRERLDGVTAPLSP